MNVYQMLVQEGVSEQEAAKYELERTLWNKLFHSLMEEGRTWRQAAEEADRLVYDHN